MRTSSVSLHQLLAPLYAVESIAECNVYGISVDSRQTQPGDLFIACPGHTQDARAFIDQAITKGAVAVLTLIDTHRNYASCPVPVIEVETLQPYIGPLIARFYGNPSHYMTVIGVTGTNGKTSVTHFIAQCLEYLHKPCALMGTLGFGRLTNLSDSINTTPGSLDIQKFMQDMHDISVDHIAMEVSSHGLDQERVRGVQFDIGVYTNLSRDHLDYHGDMQHYAKTKAQLLKWPGLSCAIINQDDAWAQLMQATTAPTITYGIEEKSADIRPLRIAYQPAAMDMTLQTPWGMEDFYLPLMGRFNVYNILATVGVLGQLGYALLDIKNAISALHPVPGRLQCLAKKPHQPQVIVDYAHTPDAMIQVLKAIREHQAAHITCVFGCGGDRDKGKRPLMLKAALAGADSVIITSDNPRHEAPEAIIKDIVHEACSQAPYHIIADRSVAIEQAIGQASPHTVVVILGKGHETYQDINGIQYPFSDVEHAEQALAARGTV